MNDIKIFKILGKKVFIRNGVGYGFISDKYLYDNGFIEIGIGRVTSGMGDWAGGFDRVTTCPLKIIVDKQYIIQKIETDSFYNSSYSKDVEKIAEKIKRKLKIGKKFIIKDNELKKQVSTILNYIPCKNHIGHDVFQSPHMLEHYTDPKQHDYYSNFENPKNCEYENNKLTKE
jgi:hypothetical protein